MKRKAKSIAISVAALLVLCSFGACNDTTEDDNLFVKNDILTTSGQDNNNDIADSIGEIDKSYMNNIIYKNDNVMVTKCVPLAEANVVSNIWDLPTEDELFAEYGVIADVTIKSLEEVAITYEFMESACISYETLATVSTNKIYYTVDENINQEFVVAIPNASRCFDEDFPEIAIDKRCILFISSTENLDDSLELHNYADYYLGGPANIINIDGLECTANKLFSDYSSSSFSAAEKCSMPLNDFENTLIAKINEKK
ncbi:MAG: hypothetical protein J1E40_13455 [Oscillospiraceae bacterium]|nr:hypothetical protein [Oscillospiraceae bacterium]